MNKFFTGFLLVLTVLGSVWYLRFIYSYERWFDTNLISTIWTLKKEKEVSAILNQPFFYLAKGSTSKAYVSADGQFVLKTFLEKNFVSKGAFSLPLIQKLANRRKELRVKYNRIFGPINAYQMIPKETGMIYYQFIRSSGRFNRQVQLVEQDGSTFWLDPNQAEFLIQKKAVCVDQYLLDHVKRGDLEGAKKGIAKLLNMTKTLYDQGMVLVVLQFLDNFGFIGDEPIRIDVEHVRFDPKWKQKGKIHLKKELAHFRRWVEEYTPELIPFFDEIVLEDQLVK